MRFVEGGLSDLSVSRTSFDWGVKVPGSDGHVMYVWVDALTNYLTGAGYPLDTQRMAKYWPADLHLIGKDIVRFHAVYWPAFLMSAGIALPKKVFGHGFLLNRGEKMSKSTGNIVDPVNLAARYGVDALRYFLLRDVSFGNDGSWSEEAIVLRCNAELANGLGNLAQRSLSMIAKNCGGVLPAPGGEPDPKLDDGLEAQIADAMTSLALHKALEAIAGVVASANQYFADSAPWALRKTDPARADAILYWTAETVRRVALALRWAVPESADKLLALVGGGEGVLTPGIVLPEPQGVFPRLDLLVDEA